MPNVLELRVQVKRARSTGQPGAAAAAEGRAGPGGIEQGRADDGPARSCNLGRDTAEAAALCRTGPSLRSERSSLLLQPGLLLFSPCIDFRGSLAAPSYSACAQPREGSLSLKPGQPPAGSLTSWAASPRSDSYVCSGLIHAQMHYGVRSHSGFSRNIIPPR